jgi:predicted RNase H-like nuclease (RuvC/YqgF family)
MVESIMFFGIGFLIASLLGLIVVPLVHNRAVRLTTRRLEAATPMSMTEIQAEKDQLRAEFAMSTRRLEMSVEQLKARSTSQLGELGKKSEAINRLKVELGDKAATIFAIEAREKALRDQIRATEQEYAVKAQALEETSRTLSAKESDLAKLTTELDERTVLSDAQRVEIVALETQTSALRDQIDKFEKDLKETEDRLTRERAAAEAAAKELADERTKVENLGNRVDQLERQLVAQTTEAELMGRRVQELEARLSEQGRLLVEREYDITQLRAEIDRGKKTEDDLRTELAAVEIRRSSAAEMLKTEKVRLEGEMEQVRDDRNRLQREIAAMKREAESSWAAERVENALLRERINDIAAEVARLTAVLEGPGSPIDVLLAGEASGPHPERPANGNAAVNGEAAPAQGNLADRIRALQAKASRLTPAS